MNLDRSHGPSRHGWKATLVSVAITALLATSAQAAPRVSVSSPTVVEGRAGARELVFEVTLDAVDVTSPPRRALAEPVVVDYRTADVTARADRGDYEPVSGTLRFDVLGATNEVRVPVFGDLTYETNETLSLDLVGIAGAISDSPRGIGTILNDEAPPLLSVSDQAGIEGAAGWSTLAFTLTVAGLTEVDVAVDVITVDGTARAILHDYQGLVQTVVIPAATKTYSVLVNIAGETVAEPTETFSLQLSNPRHATLARAVGLGKILNDDLPLGPNEFANPSFNPDLAGWQSLGCGQAMSCHDHPGPSGPHAAHVFATGMGEYGVQDAPGYHAPAAHTGERHRASAWVWGNHSDGTAVMRVQQFLNGRLVETRESAPVRLARDRYQELVLDVAARHAGVTYRAQVVNQAVAPGESFHVDDFMVRPFVVGDVPPTLTAADRITAKPGVPVVLDVLASDWDREPIDLLTADLSDFPADHRPTFEVSADRSRGRLSWTAAPSEVRAAPYTIRYFASNGSAVERTAQIQVVENPAGIAGNGSFEEHLGGWRALRSAMTRVPNARQGSWAVEVARGPEVEVPVERDPSDPVVVGAPGPEPDRTYGIGDHPDWVPVVAAAGATYHFRAWVRSSATGAVRMQITERSDASDWVGSASSEVSLGEDWRLVTVTYTAREPGTRLGIEILSDAADPDAAFQVDGVQVQLDRHGPSEGGGGGGGKLPPDDLRSLEVAVQPNPVRAAAVLAIVTREPGPLFAEVYDLSGRRIAVVAKGEYLPAGTHRFELRPAGRLAQGMYFYRAVSAGAERRGAFVVIE
jgi:hypothetical protein